MSEKITFKKLVEKISKSTRLSEQTTNSFIHKLADIIESHLEKGDNLLEVKTLDESCDHIKTNLPMVTKETETAASVFTSETEKSGKQKDSVKTFDVLIKELSSPKKKWPVNNERNSDEIDDPNIILVGKSSNLPEFSDPDNLTQKDRETVARGYLYVYDWMTDHQPDKAKYCSWAVGSYSKEQLQRVSARVNETDLAFAFQQ